MRYFLIDSLHSCKAVDILRRNRCSGLHKYQIASIWIALSTTKGASESCVACPISTAVDISLIPEVKKNKGACQNIEKGRILKGFD